MSRSAHDRSGTDPPWKGSLVDAHAHLDGIEDLDRALAEAAAAGVGAVVGVGMDLASNRKILEAAARHPGLIFPALGIHPWNLVEEELDEVLGFIDSHVEACVAVGEVGLDYKVRAPKALQKRAFTAALDIARRHGKPVIVHSRYSHMRTHQMVREAGLEKAVFHWYSGPPDVLEALLEDGYTVSATPALEYSQGHIEAIRRAPLDRILIETDCPVAYRGKSSRPADLLTTLRALARIKALDEDEVARATMHNALAFYGLIT